MAKTITMDQATTDAIAKAPRSWVIAQRVSYSETPVLHREFGLYGEFTTRKEALEALTKFYREGILMTGPYSTPDAEFWSQEWVIEIAQIDGWRIVRVAHVIVAEY